MKLKLKLQMKRKSFLIMVGIVFLALIVNIVSAGIWNDFLNLFSDSDPMPFSIIEIKTEYGITENIITLEIKDLIDKDQYITNISEIFADHYFTDEIEIKEVLLYQDYNANVYGYLNESQGKYKIVEIIEECSSLNETGNFTCVNITYYYDDKNNLLDCDYILEDKSCLKIIYGVIGTEIKSDFFNIPTTKEKIVIDGLKIEQKQDGFSIPLPKGSTIQLKIKYSHPLAYRLEVPNEVNKYDIKITTADGSVVLDPIWLTNWEKRKEINITDLTGDLVNLEINTTELYDGGRLQANCGDIRFTDENDTELYSWNETCITNDNATKSLFWLNISLVSSGSIYMYYNNSVASSSFNGNETFEFFDDFLGSTLDTNKWTKYGTGTLTIGNSQINFSGDTGARNLNGDVLESIANFSNNTIYRSNHYLDNDGTQGGAIGLGAYTYTDTTHMALRMDRSGSDSNIRFSTSNADADPSITNFIDLGRPWTTDWGVLDIRWNSTAVKFDLLADDGSPHYTNTATTTLPKSSMKLRFGGVKYGLNTAFSIKSRYIFVGDLTSVDSPYTIGAEESAPPTYNLNGTVKDSNNVVVNNATIIIINQINNTIVNVTSSNSTGGWTYDLGSDTGTYLVVAYDPNNSTRDGDADPHIVVS